MISITRVTMENKESIKLKTASCKFIHGEGEVQIKDMNGLNHYAKISQLIIEFVNTGKIATSIGIPQHLFKKVYDLIGDKDYIEIERF